jgi:nicotinamide riboside transporter PnuC
MVLNFAFWLSLVLAAFGCLGLVLAGNGKWYGWGLGLAAQPIWATYAIVTKGYGLLLTCLMYGTFYSRNLIKWRRERMTPIV